MGKVGEGSRVAFPGMGGVREKLYRISVVKNGRRIGRSLPPLSTPFITSANLGVVVMPDAKISHMGCVLGLFGRGYESRHDNWILNMMNVLLYTA
jgi:hypothetical protein